MRGRCRPLCHPRPSTPQGRSARDVAGSVGRDVVPCPGILIQVNGALERRRIRCAAFGLRRTTAVRARETAYDAIEQAARRPFPEPALSVFDLEVQVLSETLEVVTCEVEESYASWLHPVTEGSVHRPERGRHACCHIAPQQACPDSALPCYSCEKREQMPLDALIDEQVKSSIEDGGVAETCPHGCSCIGDDVDLRVHQRNVADPAARAPYSSIGMVELGDDTPHSQPGDA